MYRESGSLTLSGDFVPKLLPYMQCVNTRAEIEMAKAPMNSGQAVRSAEQRAVQSCADQRQAARADALTVTAGKPVSASEVDTVLESIDHSFEAVAIRLDASNNKLKK